MSSSPSPPSSSSSSSSSSSPPPPASPLPSSPPSPPSHLPSTPSLSSPDLSVYDLSLATAPHPAPPQRRPQLQPQPQPAASPPQPNVEPGDIELRENPPAQGSLAVRVLSSSSSPIISFEVPFVSAPGSATSSRSVSLGNRYVTPASEHAGADEEVVSHFLRAQSLPLAGSSSSSNTTPVLPTAEAHRRPAHSSRALPAISTAKPTDEGSTADMSSSPSLSSCSELEVFGFVTKPATFAQIPDQSLVHAMSYLSSRELCTLMCVSKRVKGLASNASLWEQLFVRDFDLELPYVHKSARAIIDRKALAEKSDMVLRKYRAEYQGAMDRRNLRIARREAHELEERRATYTRRFRRWWECYHLRLMSAFVPVLLLLATIFIADHLDGEMDLGDAFVPLWVLFALVCFGSLSIWFVHSNRDHWLFSSVGQVGCLPVFWHEVVRERRSAHLVAVGILLCMIGFAVLLLYRLNDHVEMAWSTVFVPVWASMFLLCLAPLTGWGSSSSRRSVFGMIWCFLLLPFLIVTILAVLRLEGDDDMKMELIMVPFWIVDAVVLLVPTFALVLATLAKCLSRSVLGIGTGDFKHVSIICAVVYVAVGPLIAFEILLSLRDHGRGPHQFMATFVPLIVWQSVFSLGGLSVCLFS